MDSMVDLATLEQSTKNMILPSQQHAHPWTTWSLILLKLVSSVQHSQRNAELAGQRSISTPLDQEEQRVQSTDIIVEGGPAPLTPLSSRIVSNPGQKYVCWRPAANTGDHEAPTFKLRLNYRLPGSGLYAQPTNITQLGSLNELKPTQFENEDELPNYKYRFWASRSIASNLHEWNKESMRYQFARHCSEGWKKRACIQLMTGCFVRNVSI